MAMMLDNVGLTTRAAAEAYVGGVCFKLGPPRLIGAELEWLTARDDDDCSRPDLAELAAALGPHAPKSLAPASPARPLPGGSYITVEPGGQIELSSAPYPSADQLCRALSGDETYLRSLLASASITAFAAAADSVRTARRLLQLPRYRAMEDVFTSIGPFGKLMMCNTAATQISVDAGRDRAEVAQRWRALTVMGPALLAAFACSPRMRGAPEGEWASQRMRAWLLLDQDRTVPVDGPDPVAAYAKWSMDVPLLCVIRPGRTDWSAPAGATFGDWVSGSLNGAIGRMPCREDLDYHLTTLFPPVRASGHFEIRYIDAQPGGQWAVPIHLVDALMSSRQSVAAATEIAEPTGQRWLDAARLGLADDRLRAAAVELLNLAATQAGSPAAMQLLESAADRCRRGAMPTEV